MQCDRRAQDDEERDQIGEGHADDRVEFDTAQLPAYPRRRFGTSSVLHLLAGLPEKK